MKIETEALDNQQTKLIAELDAETLDKYKHQAARKISRSQKIPGFRPGKAPYDLIRRMVGDEALQQEAIELMLDEVYPQVLKEANLNPSGPGKLEEIVSMDPPKFAFVIPMPPEVTLGEYKELRREYNPEPVTEDKVEATLRRLTRSYATAEPVERPAQKGDMVSFSLSGKRLNPAEGENETLVEETPYQMIAGENEEEEEAAWPYEGFSDELMGLSANDTKTVTHTFSEESPYPDLSGKEAEFTIKVDGVKEMHLPELNDEFAQTLGEFENLDALRNAIRTQLEQNSSQQYDQNYFDALINELVEQSIIKYPPHLLEDEINDFIGGLQRNLERDHMDLETYLKMRQMDRETFIEQEVKPAATRRLERSLVLEEFAHREDVELKRDEIQSIYLSAMQQMQQSEQFGKGKGKNRANQQELANSVAINTVNSIFNQRLMSRLKAIATGKGDEVAAAAEQQPAAEELPVGEITGEEQPVAEEQAESAGPTDAAQPVEPEAAGEAVESNAVTSEPAADAEITAAQEDLLEEEQPQGDQESGENQA